MRVDILAMDLPCDQVSHFVPVPAVHIGEVGIQIDQDIAKALIGSDSPSHLVRAHLVLAGLDVLNTHDTNLPDDFLLIRGESTEQKNRQDRANYGPTLPMSTASISMAKLILVPSSSVTVQ